MRAIRVITSGWEFACSNNGDSGARTKNRGLWYQNDNYIVHVGFRKWVEGDTVDGGSGYKVPNIEFVQFADGSILEKKLYGPYLSIKDYMNNNYAFFNSDTSTPDGKGLFGDNGPGEPLQVDGTQYKMRMFGFGKTKSDIGTAADGVTKYIINSDPKGLIDLGNRWLTSANNGWRANQNTFQYNPASGFAFRTKSDSFGLVYGTPPEYKTVVDVDGLKWDMASGKYLGPTSKDALTFVARTYHQTDSTIPTLTATIDGEQVLSKNNVKANEAVSIGLSDWWSRAADGWHEMTLSAGTGAKKSFDTVIRFKKGIVGLEVKGKPADREKMPTACFVASAVNLAEKATATWYVCNNANDAAPAWEEYAGDRHVFANKKKTSEKWAVAWRIVVDNGTSTRRSELIKQVAMAVI